MRVVVTGLLATYPAGGVVWDYGQYLLGLQDLGCDVWYLEDSGEDSWDDEGRNYHDGPGGPVAFLADSLTALSPTLADRWHLRTSDGRTYGLDPVRLREVLSGADLLLNVSGGALLREEYTVCAHTALVDTDPGLNHFVNYPAWDAAPGWEGALSWRDHDHHLTYAELAGLPHCGLPDLGITWRPTRPPVCLDRWQPEPPGRAWTTVMSWQPYRHAAPIRDAQGREYFAKEAEFPKVEHVPARLPDLAFEVAVKRGAPVEQWRRRGWAWADAAITAATAARYRAYVQSSRAELSVAKNVYVETRSGWSSCRSTCYLAAGRPVVTQDTGFSEVLPIGEGLLAWTNEEEAVDAVRRVEQDYGMHAEAARTVAEEHFAAGRVLSDLLEAVSA